MVVTCFKTQESTVIISHIVIRFLLDHHIEVFDSTVVIAYLITEESPVKAGNQIIFIHTDYLIVIIHRTTEVIHLVTYQTTIDIIATFTGIQADGLVQIRQSTFQIICLIKQDRTVTIGRSIIGVHFNSLIIIGKRFYRIAFLGVHSTTGQVIHRIFRMRFHQHIESLFGIIIVFPLDIGYGFINKHLAVFGFKFKTFVVVGNRFGIFFLALAGNTAGIISLNQKWIPLET